MAGEKGDDDRVSVSASVPSRLLPIFTGSAILVTGMGVGNLAPFGPNQCDITQIEHALATSDTAAKNAATAIEMAQTALDVKGQQGQENLIDRQSLDRLERKYEELRYEIIERTQSRFTAGDHIEYANKHGDEHRVLNERVTTDERRISQMERDLDYFLDMHSESERGKHQ